MTNETIVNETVAVEAVENVEVVAVAPVAKKAFNPTKKLISEAVSNYRDGSRGIVKAFEAVLTGYWGSDSCNPDNLQFFINALKRFPVLQNTAKGLLAKFGKFKVKLNMEETSKDKKDKVYSIVNDENKATKEEKAKYRIAVKEFIAAEYTSLVHEKSVSIQTEFTFDKEKSAKALKSALVKQLKDMMKANGSADASVMRRIIDNAVHEVFAQGSVAKIRKDVREEAVSKAA